MSVFKFRHQCPQCCIPWKMDDTKSRIGINGEGIYCDCGLFLMDNECWVYKELEGCTVWWRYDGSVKISEGKVPREGFVSFFEITLNEIDFSITELSEQQIKLYQTFS